MNKPRNPQEHPDQNRDRGQDGDVAAEEQLVRDASQGDLSSMEQLFVKHLPGLQAYLRRNAGPVLHQESAADLAQSVCREVLQHLADDRFEYRGEAEFKQWLYQAALLKVKNRRRYYGAEKRQPPGQVSLHGSQQGSLEDFFRTLATPSREAVVNEQLDAVAAAFAELTDEQRQVIELARIKGLSHKHIATRLDITEAHSRVLLSRALARLVSVARAHLRE